MKPEYAILEEKIASRTTFDDGKYTRVLVVDENKARVRGNRIVGSKFWRDKFENMLVLSRLPERIKVVYR